MILPLYIFIILYHEVFLYYYSFVGILVNPGKSTKLRVGTLLPQIFKIIG